MGLGTLTNAVALVVSVGLSLALVKTPFGFAGIALSSGITFTLAAFLRLALLNKSLREEEAAISFADVWPTIFHTTLATSTAAIAAAMSLAAVRNFAAFPGDIGTIVNRVFQLGVPLFFGGFAFAGTAFLLESEQMDEILARLQRGRGPAPDKKPAPVRETHPVVPQWLAPHALLRWVQANLATAAHCNLNKRVAQLLDRPRWQERNVGAKLCGLLKMRAHRVRLCAMAVCRKPAPFRYRLLGADFREPGFARRNAVDSLALLGDPDRRTEEAFLGALKDPYWEVRTAAADALGELAAHLSDETRAAALGMLPDLAEGRCFEAAAASVRAIGALARDDSALRVFRRLHYHPNWQVRDAVVCAYEELHRRGVVSDGAKLKALLDDVLVTCDSFRPFFQLKENLVRVRSKFEGATASAGESA